MTVLSDGKGESKYNIHISKKKIPMSILEKIGQPSRKKYEGLANVKYDLSPYGITDQ